MNKKRFISFTGNTCVGKSTILNALKQSDRELFMIIPQVTCRKPRTDDIPEHFIYSRCINPDDMFLYNKELSFGISNKSILDFINSDFPIALVINGTDEIEMLNSKAEKTPDIEFKNILLTFSDNYEDEIVILEQQLTQCFDKDNFTKRFNFFKHHTKNKLFNPIFVENNIDLHLTRQMGLSRWVFELSKITGVSAHKLMYNLEHEIEIGKKQRHYIDPKVAGDLIQIISALQDNKR